MATKSKKIPSLIPRRSDPQIIPATPTSLEVDNKPIGLNSNLMPLNAPISTNRGFVSNTAFDANHDKNVISSYQLQQQPWVDCTDEAPVIIDLSKGKRQRVTIAGNRTLVLINGLSGQTFLFRVKQDGTGSRLVTWFPTIFWAGGAAPTLTTTANKADLFGFVVTGANTFDGVVIGLDI